MKNPILHITAYSPKIDKYVDLHYVSIKQAKFFNPSLTNFTIKEFSRK